MNIRFVYAKFHNYLLHFPAKKEPLNVKKDKKVKVY